LIIIFPITDSKTCGEAHAHKLFIIIMNFINFIGNGSILGSLVFVYTALIMIIMRNESILVESD